MDYMDYCQKLGIGFDDPKKQSIFISRIQLFLQSHSDIPFNENQENKMCYQIGTVSKLENKDPLDMNWDSKSPVGLQRVWLYLEERKNDFKEFLASLIIFYNTYSGAKKDRLFIIETIKNALKDSHIQYAIVEDNDGLFIFPKGAKELDDALVSQPLEWLSKYPQARSEWIDAIKDYSDLTDEKASEVADKFRKALERFFQEFFNSTKSLENLESEYGAYMKTNGVPSEISNNLETLMQGYTNFMNNYAKHHNQTGKNVLEYILYQTGNIMRLLITLKQNEKGEKE